MAKRHLALIVLAAVLMPTAFVRAQAANNGIKIGVVDVNLVFHSVQETKNIEAQLRSEQERIASLAKARNSELQTLADQLKLMNADSQPYDDQMHQIEKKKGEFELEVKLQQIALQRTMARQLKDSYDKVQASVAEVAKQKGLDLVLTRNNVELPKDVKAENVNPDQLGAALAQRNPVYMAPSLDITPAVIASYDAKNGNGSSATPAPTPAPAK